MDRVNAMLADEELIWYFHRLEELEQNRQYCRHGLQHCLDVARIGYILMLEDGVVSPSRCGEASQDGLCAKELFYAAALAHDLGRVEEYTDGTPHDEAGVRIAGKLLAKHGFSEKETEMICRAVGCHRKPLSTDILSEYLFRADKLSRNCFDCRASDSCKWSDEKKNAGICC